LAALEIKSEVAGTVWKVEKAAGESVQREDVLIIIESMKMEIPITTPIDGQIVKIVVAEGDQVSEGQVIATINTP
jgi:acetyl-CoA carboxylase biotin carboxyl carrier protein